MNAEGGGTSEDEDAGTGFRVLASAPSGDHRRIGAAGVAGAFAKTSDECTCLYKPKGNIGALGTSATGSVLAACRLALSRDPL